MKKALIIPCKGIGDGLIMMVSAYALYQHGYAITVAHPSLSSLQDWFFPCSFIKMTETMLTSFPQFDTIIVQNDNSAFLKEVKSLQKKGFPIHVIYPTYEKGKHELTEKDIVLSPGIAIAKALGKAMQQLLEDPTLNEDNGVLSKETLTHRKVPRRVILHPTSTAADRTWSQKKFLQTYRSLEKQGFEPLFIVSPHEREEWRDVEKKGYKILSFTSLSHLADFIYESGYLIGNESGLSHLASNLFIPTLVIAGLKKRILQWQPGWGHAEILCPASWIPNPKILRIRDRYWQQWISAKRVMREFNQLLTLFNELK